LRWPPVPCLRVAVSACARVATDPAAKAHLSFPASYRVRLPSWLIPAPRRPRATRHAPPASPDRFYSAPAIAAGDALLILPAHARPALPVRAHAGWRHHRDATAARRAALLPAWRERRSPA